MHYIIYVENRKTFSCDPSTPSESDISDVDITNDKRKRRQEQKRDAMRRYRESVKGKVKESEYRKSAKGKQKLAETQSRYEGALFQHCCMKIAL